MHIIAIDLEMAQPSRKIIELGYVIANPKNKDIKLRRTILVNPHEQLSQEIINLTGITQADVDSGVELHEAYNMMCADINQYQCFKSVIEWSTDHIELRTQLGITCADYIFILRALDVKSLFQMYTMVTPNTKTVAGLEKALEILGIKFQGRPHRAEDDAYNTILAFFAITDKMKKFDLIEKAMK